MATPVTIGRGHRSATASRTPGGANPGPSDTPAPSDSESSASLVADGADPSAAESSPNTPPSSLQDDDDSISAIHLKLPPYWNADPTIWFIQVESMFRTRGVRGQSAKYEHVVSSLSPEIAMEIRDVLVNPPDSNQYDHLKTALLSRTQQSQKQQLQQLLTAEHLGDRKPSQLLRRMQQLMGPSSEDSSKILRELFLQRLPTQVQAIIASSPSDLSLAAIAAMADKIHRALTTMY